MTTKQKEQLEEVKRMINRLPLKAQKLAYHAMSINDPGRENKRIEFKSIINNIFDVVCDEGGHPEIKDKINQRNAFTAMFGAKIELIFV